MSELNLSTVGILSNIFEQKKWIFQTERKSQEVFTKFCEMISIFDDDEQKLLLNLTRCYSYYSFTEYQGLLVDAFSKISNAYLQNVERLIVAPLVKPADIDQGRTKSGHSLIYAAQHIAIPENPDLSKIKLSVLVNPKFKRSTYPEKKLLVILIDDFVGSGDTAKDAVEGVKNHLSENDDIVVVSLATMEQGIKYLNSLNINFLWSLQISKGIEENPYLANKLDAYEMIDKIWEKYLDISETYKRGHKASEALVTLVRTPNNTLPMYWCNRSRAGRKWPSPFPR